MKKAMDSFLPPVRKSVCRRAAAHRSLRFARAAATVRNRTHCQVQYDSFVAFRRVSRVLLFARESHEWQTTARRSAGWLSKIAETISCRNRARAGVSSWRDGVTETETSRVRLSLRSIRHEARERRADRWTVSFALNDDDDE
jgi:hypothetical protein